MNTHQAATSHATSHSLFAAAARYHSAATWAVGLTFVITAAGQLAMGQDRIRIVEAPRTAKLETRAVSPGATSTPAARSEAVEGPTVYEERFVTQMQDEYHTVYVPVIASQTEPTPAWWNPLGISTRTFRPHPVVRWEPRVEKRRVAVRYREVVPESTQLSRATVSASSADRRRAGSPDSVALRDAPPLVARPRTPPSSANSTVLPAEQIGGISQLESDRPRFGARPGMSDPRIVR